VHFEINSPNQSSTRLAPHNPLPTQTLQTPHLHLRPIHQSQKRHHGNDASVFSLGEELVQFDQGSIGLEGIGSVRRGGERGGGGGELGADVGFELGDYGGVVGGGLEEGLDGGVVWWRGHCSSWFVLWYLKLLVRYALGTCCCVSLY
jgi:hypothetical protein